MCFRDDCVAIETFRPGFQLADNPKVEQFRKVPAMLRCFATVVSHPARAVSASAPSLVRTARFLSHLNLASPCLEPYLVHELVDQVNSPPVCGVHVLSGDWIGNTFGHETFTRVAHNNYYF